MAERPRILMLGSPPPNGGAEGPLLPSETQVVQADSWTAVFDWLGKLPFNALVANLDTEHTKEELHAALQARQILDALGDGIALVDRDSRIRWANRVFASWCAGEVIGKDFYEALDSPGASASNQERPLCFLQSTLVAAAATSTGEGTTTPTSARLVCRSGAEANAGSEAASRHLDVQVTVLPGTGEPLLLVQARDVTAQVSWQTRVALLHQAGRELASLAPEQLAEMSVAERIDLLKRNIRRVIRELLHFDLIEIRLLNPQTGLLVPLLQEGMSADATARPLRVALEGQGVTGYVAATGRSYLCADTLQDPHYLTGAPDAHSSLTVPLKYQDRIIGTLNVESPRPNAFSQEDLHYAELFSRDVADALHTLELLSAEKESTATQSIEAINREVALPVDDILANTTCILDRYIGPDPELANALRKILVSARLIKQTIQKVGEDMAPAGAHLAPTLGPGIASPTPPPAQLRGVRVLVADNDDRVRRSAHSLLGRWGCIVETARDGREALTMARLGSYDVILADIRLPDMTGYQVYRGLREAQPEARVILMTGYGYDPHHSLVHARQDGLRFILYKPFRVDQLLAALTTPLPTSQSGPA